jgi:phospholipid:diacylglycerol acyltransferase
MRAQTHIYHDATQCNAGSDPPGIKLRAAKALEAVDFFIPSYWVFSRLIASLADIGYDNNNMASVHQRLQRYACCVHLWL